MYRVEPQLVDACIPLELIAPFPSVFIGGIFPFWTHSLLEKCIIRLKRNLGCLGDIIEDPTHQFGLVIGVAPPEFFYAVEGDDLFQQICPVLLWTRCAGSLGEPQGPGVHERMFDVEVLGIVEYGQGLLGDDCCCCLGGSGRVRLTVE